MQLLLQSIKRALKNTPYEQISLIVWVSKKQFFFFFHQVSPYPIKLDTTSPYTFFFLNHINLGLILIELNTY